MGTTASIHTGRFVLLLQEIGYNVRIFNYSIDYAEDEHIRNSHLYVSHSRASANNNVLTEWPQPFLIRFACRVWNLVCRVYPGARKRFNIWSRHDDRLATTALIRIVKKWEPDLVISLKMQNDGYVVARARKAIGKVFPRWLHFNWGTDIAYFGLDPIESPHHNNRIRAVLKGCDFFIADCDRDVRLAREFGFEGESLGSCIATGGFDLTELSEIRGRHTGPRKNIIVKGRHWPPVGVAMNIVQALAGLTSELNGWRIKFMMCTSDVEQAVKALAAEGAPFEILPRLPYPALLAEFAQARFTISATNVDGTPLFLAETISLGSVPVHSDLDSVREWVDDGENGLLFSSTDIQGMRRQIRRALCDNAFIETASRKNLDVGAKRMNRQVIRDLVKRLIEDRIMLAPIGARRQARSPN